MNRREFLTDITALAVIPLLPINLIPRQNSYITDDKRHFLNIVVNEGKAMYYIDGEKAEFLDTDFVHSPCHIYAPFRVDNGTLQISHFTSMAIPTNQDENDLHKFINWVHRHGVDCL